MTAPAGGDATVTLEGLPLDTELAEARLTVDNKGENTLATDDRAWALRPKPPSQNVLLVSEGNSFLEKGLNLMPGIKLFKVSPADYAPSEGFGLTVLDGCAVAAAGRQPSDFQSAQLYIAAGFGDDSVSGDGERGRERPGNAVRGPVEHARGSGQANSCCHSGQGWWRETSREIPLSSRESLMGGVWWPWPSTCTSRTCRCRWRSLLC